MLDAVGIAATLTVMAVAAVELQAVFNLVSGLLTLAALAGVIFGVWYRAAYQAEKSTADAWKSGREAQHARAERLDRELATCRGEITELREAVARYEALPNLERIMQWLNEDRDRQDKLAQERMTGAMERVEQAFASHEGRVETRFAKHEERAQERHESQIAVLSGIAAHLERLNRKDTP